MDLTNLSKGVQKRKLKKRVGRGIGSGHGKTSSRGHNKIRCTKKNGHENPCPSTIA